MSTMPMGSVAEAPLTMHRPRPVRIGLQVEDHLVRHGLQHLLSTVDELDLVGPDAEILVIDAMAPAPSTQGSEARLVLLHDGMDDASVLAAVRAGVSALVARSASPEEIVAVVRWVARGGDTLDRASAAAVVRALQTEAGPPPVALTVREQEVVDLVVRGLDNRRIGQQLFIAESTVKFHLRRIRAKLGARSRTELVAIAVRDAPAEINRRQPAPPRRPARPARPILR